MKSVLGRHIARHIGSHLEKGNSFVVKFSFYEFLDPQNIGFNTLFPMKASLSPEISIKSVLAAMMAAIMETIFLSLLNLVSTNTLTLKILDLIIYFY